MYAHDFDYVRRRQVWEAISELWLDTEHDDASLNSIAKRLVESGYSLRKIEDIYANEVAPVVFQNLSGLGAGIWTGFDPDWLEEQILATRRQRKQRSWLWKWVGSAVRYWRTRMVRKNWLRVKELLDKGTDVLSC